MNRRLAVLSPMDLPQKGIAASGHVAFYAHPIKIDAVTVALFAWIVVALSSELNTFYVPYVDWLSLPFILVIASRNARRLRLPICRPSLGAIPLVGIMALTSMLNNMNVQGLLQATKLSFIFLILCPMIGGESKFVRVSMLSAGFATILNAVLMVFGRLGLLPTSAEYGAARWGTVLNLPGPLAFLGLLTFGYGAYGSLQSKRHKWWYFAVAVSSVYIVLADGSRTGALCLILLTVYVACVSLRSRTNRRTAFRRLLCLTGAVLGVTIIAGGRSTLQTGSGLPVNSRVTKLFEGNTGGIGDTIQDNDLARYGAMVLAINEIRMHPLWGHGLGSTKYFPDGETVVVHNAYLQSWADLGLLGFLAITLTLLWWVPQLRGAVKSIQKLPFPGLRALHHGAICGLFAYSFICLYHPIGVEISDWIHFIIPSSIFHALLRSAGLAYSPPRKNGAI